MVRISFLLTVLLAINLPVFADGESEYISLHQQEMEAHRDWQPDKLREEIAADTEIIPLQTRAATPHPCKTVFGYLPYWESSANLRYDLMTHLAVFAVEVNSDGTLGSDHGWPQTSMINAAHSAGVKVILVATLFNNSNIYTLINTPSYKNAFFANILAKMQEGGADGVNIDFETGGGGSSSWVGQIHTFMADLSAYLKAVDPEYEISFAGPAIAWSGSWNMEALADSCDAIFIMGYAFAGSFSSYSGANSPLTGGTYNMTYVVNNTYADADPDKLILGIPYYGHHWTTVSSSARSEVISFQSSTRFLNDAVNVQSYGLLWDSYTQTPWYRWHDGTYWHQVWFDNADSLELKYDLAISAGYQGVGMWALNYDGTRTELWDLLDEKFGGCYTYCDVDGDGVATEQDTLIFQFCMQGPDYTYNEGNDCLAGDTDQDGDVDLADFATCQNYFKGS